MTISTEINYKSFAGPGNGFAYDKPVFDLDDIYVEIEDADGNVSVPTKDGAGTYDFTVAGTYDAASFRYPAGATVTLNTALPAGYAIYIENRVLATQASDYTTGGDINRERLETDLDRLAVIMQASKADLTKAVKIASTAGITPTDLSPLADGYVKFNPAGTDLEVKALATIGTIEVPIPIAQGGTNAVNATAARTNLGLDGSSGNLSDGDISFLTTQRVLGRNTAGAGVGEEVTGTQLLDWLYSTRGGVLYRGASAWAGLAAGTAKQVLTTAGAGADPSWDYGGKIIQRAVATNFAADLGSDPINSYKSFASLIAADDSIPLYSEGTMVFSESFTPLKSTSTIVVEVFLSMISASAAVVVVGSLYKDGADPAVRSASILTTGLNYVHQLFLRHEEAAASTSPRTYAFKMGSNSNTVYLNGISSTRYYGGAGTAYFLITEYAA